MPAADICFQSIHLNKMLNIGGMRKNEHRVRGSRWLIHRRSLLFSFIVIRAYSNRAKFFPSVIKISNNLADDGKILRHDIGKRQMIDM